MFYSCEKLHKTSKQKLFTECVYFEQDRITSCKTKNMFLFHCVVSDFALKQKQNVFVSLSFQWLGSETKAKCFCFTQFLMIWQWNQNILFLFHCTFFGPVGIPKTPALHIKYQLCSASARASNCIVVMDQIGESTH